MKKLTQKQENFRNDLFAGIPQRDAYINHYNTEHMLPATIDREACALANNHKVATSLAEMRAGVKREAIADVAERQERLTDIIRHKPSPEKVSGKERILAIGELNKMDHIYTEPVTVPKVTVHTSIFILPDGQRLTAKQLKEGSQEGSQSDAAEQRGSQGIYEA